MYEYSTVNILKDSALVTHFWNMQLENILPIVVNTKIKFSLGDSVRDFYFKSLTIARDDHFELFTFRKH